MDCPICNKHKAKRLCPARTESICTTCCGTEREVTIDCPSDCPHLMTSRVYDMGRMEPDFSKMPFPEVKFERHFARDRRALLAGIDYAICAFAAEHREVVDMDLLAALQNLAETYRTQTSGLIYEKPLDYALQRALYEELKTAIQKYREEESKRLGLSTVRDGEIRDALIFLSQLCAVHANGRPKGRAYLDLTRQQFPEDAFKKASSNLVLL